MSYLGYTDFSDRTRKDFMDKILYRLDCIYSGWLYGEYYDGDLHSCMMNDPEYTDLNNLFVELNIHFRPDLDVRFYSFSPSFWLDVRGFSDFPTRQTFYHYTPNELKMEVKFKRARTFVMHGPDGEVKHVPCDVWPPVESDCLVSHTSVARPVVDTPRRSTRVKYPRDFYYGY
jgi:hypothetical protein